eukprot:Selendium_serpulae@DN6154_c2_g2_i1.p1
MDRDSNTNRRNQRLTQLVLVLFCSGLLFISYRSYSLLATVDSHEHRRRDHRGDGSVADRSAVFNNIYREGGSIVKQGSVPDANRAAVFNRIYEKNRWLKKGKDSHSGEGSQKLVTKTARECIGRWIEEYKIKSLGDICGDANWQTLIPNIHDITYVGYDISPIALSLAAGKNLNTSFTFKEMDICETVPVTKHDAFMIRDVLQHLSGAAGVRALKHIRESGAKYLIVSYYPGEDHNKDIRDGDMYRNNIYKPPFDVLGLPQPLDPCHNYDPPQTDMASTIAIVQINELGQSVSQVCQSSQVSQSVSQLSQSVKSSQPQLTSPSFPPKISTLTSLSPRLLTCSGARRFVVAGSTWNSVQE